MEPEVNAGKEGKNTCACGRVWELSKRKVPMRDKDSLTCHCGRTLVSWNGGCVWTAELLEDVPKNFIIVEFHHQKVADLEEIDQMVLERCQTLVKKGAMQKTVNTREGRQIAACQGEILRIIQDTPEEIEVELASGDRITVPKGSEHLDVLVGGPEYEIPV